MKRQRKSQCSGHTSPYRDQTGESESLVPFGCTDRQLHVIPTVNEVATDVSSGPASYASSLLQDVLFRESRPVPKQQFLPSASYLDICIQGGTAIPESVQGVMPNRGESCHHSNTTQFRMVPGLHDAVSPSFDQCTSYQYLPATRRAILQAASSDISIPFQSTIAREGGYRSQVRAGRD